MAYWFGLFIGQMLDPILIGIAFMLYIFTNKASTATRFLIVFVVACILAFLSGWLASTVSGAEGTLKIDAFLRGFFAFILLFSIIFGIGSSVKKIKSK